MTFLHRLRSWFLWVFRRERLERSLEEHVQEYIQHSAADKIRDGLSPEQAAGRRGWSLAAWSRRRNVCGRCSLQQHSTRA